MYWEPNEAMSYATTADEGGKRAERLVGARRQIYQLGFGRRYPMLDEIYTCAPHVSLRQNFVGILW